MASDRETDPLREHLAQVRDARNNAGARAAAGGTRGPEAQAQPPRFAEPEEERPVSREQPARQARPSRNRPPERRSGITMVHVLLAIIAVLVLIAGGLGLMLLSGALSPRQPQQNAAAGAGSQAQVPQLEVTKRATYGDWIYTCAKLPNTAETRCGIVQQLSDTKTKAPVFLWRIAQDGKGGMVAEWQTRSGVMVNRGIVLDIGDNKPTTIPFEACLPTGCRAVTNLSPEIIDGLAKAPKATATVFPVGASSGVQLTLSVKGLPDALAALKQ